MRIAQARIQHAIMILGRIRAFPLFTLVMGWSVAGHCPAQTSASERDAAGRVFVDNGDFEKGLDNWEGRGVIVTEVKHGGDHSLLLERAYVYQPPRNQRLIWIEPGHDYRVNVWVKCDGCEEQGVSVTAACLGGAGEHDRKWISKLQGANPQYIHDNGASAALVATGGTHDWKKLEAHIPANQLSKETRALFIYLRHDAQKEPRGKAYFDDLTVERLPRGTGNADLARLLPSSPSGQDANSAIEAASKLGNQASPERLTLAKDGIASYKIHVGSSQDAIELYAAEELAKYLGKISGASFEPFAHDTHPAAGPLLIVGRRNALTDKLCPDISYDRLGDDGFVIRTVGPHVVIAGNTSRGTLYGVYWLLDRKLGVRWFSPAYTFVPRTPRLRLGKLTEMQIPRFEYREIFARDGDDEAYRAHNLLNGKSHHRKATHSAPGLNSWSEFWHDQGHNFHRVVSHTQYSKSHPEYFAGGQLAMMNEDVRRIAADYFMNKLASLKGAAIPWLGFSQMDRGWAPDPAALAFAKKHGGHLSAPNADMVLDVARRVRQKYPGAKFGAMAYQWSFSPPTGMTIPDHVLMVAAPIHADFSQPYNGPKNKSIAEDIRNWAKISINIYIWDYITNFSGYMLPYPNFDSMFESIQWLAGMPSIRGYFGQGSMSSIGAEFAHLRQWVGARLLWDPKQDHRVLVDEFVEGHYGGAAPYIAEYIRLMHESKQKTGAKMALKTPVTSPYLSFEAMRRADELFVKAEEAVAGEPGFERRVATARIGVDAVILFRRGDYAREAKKAGISWDPDTQRRLQRVTDNIRSAGVTAYGEGMKDLKSYLKSMALERTVAPPLDIVQRLSDTDWMEFNDLDLRIAIGGVTITPDPLASDGGAITMKGNSPHWGIQMKLDALPSEDRWKLFASVRVDPGSGSEEATALTVGVHPGHRRTIKVSEVADGQYHTFELPATYINDAGTALWFAPPNSDTIKAMYVDRVVAVRAGASASISSDVLNPRALRIRH